MIEELKAFLQERIKSTEEWYTQYDLGRARAYKEALEYIEQKTSEK